jgi:hypothetical protein
MIHLTITLYPVVKNISVIGTSQQFALSRKLEKKLLFLQSEVSLFSNMQISM